MATELHLAKDSLALHLLLQRFQSLVDVIVANEYLHAFNPVAVPCELAEVFVFKWKTLPPAAFASP